ncbi:hypothetical protein [Streptomyces sp. NPDC020996]|uniref:hypothetical protein n=1 Tax=Streptomyces sp. NPDC020996 TaxID=3154791 RepID=UPI0033C8327D
MPGTVVIGHLTGLGGRAPVAVPDGSRYRRGHRVSPAMRGVSAVGGVSAVPQRPDTPEWARCEWSFATPGADPSLTGKDVVQRRRNLIDRIVVFAGGPSFPGWGPGTGSGRRRPPPDDPAE